MRVLLPLLAAILSIAVACHRSPHEVEPPAADVASKKDEPPPQRTEVQPVAPGGECAEGGFRLQIGTDVNEDGALQPSEIEASELLCNGRKSLVDTERVAFDSRCSGGGVIVRSGLDDDGDGTLSLAEVDQETIVCDGGTERCGPGGVRAGDITLSNAGDVAEIAGCSAIEGTLFIEADLQVLELPELQRLGGLDARGARLRLVLPRLDRVEGEVALGDASRLDADALIFVGGSLSTGAWSTALLPALGDIGGDIDLGRGNLLRAPGLEELGGALRARTSSRVEMAALRDLRGEMVVQGECSVALPALETLEGPLSVGASALELPRLHSAGTVILEHASTAPSAFEAPALTHAAAMHIRPGPGGTTVDLPSLVRLDHLSLEARPASLALPALSAVGALTLRPVGGVSLFLPPELSEVDGDLVIDMSGAWSFGGMALAAIERIGGWLRVSGAGGLSALQLPALRSAGGGFRFEDLQASLRLIEAPRLESLGSLYLAGVPDCRLVLPALAMLDGQLTSTGSLSEWQADALVTVSGAMAIRDSQLERLVLPSLQQVVGAIDFDQNPHLDPCDIARLREQLVAAGHPPALRWDGGDAIPCIEDNGLCEGSFTVTDGDYSEVETCREISGDLTIISASPDELVHLPLLERVNGNLAISGAKAGVALPELAGVGALTLLGPVEETVELPQLAQIDGQFETGRLGLELPSLERIDGTLLLRSRLVRLPALIALPTLEVADDSFGYTPVVEAHALPELGSVLVPSALSLRAASLLRIDAINAPGATALSLVAGALSSVGSVRATIVSELGIGFETPALREVGVVDIDAAFLRFESFAGLTRVHGDFVYRGTTSLGAGRHVNLRLPVLQSVGGRFEVSDRSVTTSIEAPQLASVGAAFVLRGNLALRYFRVPALAQVGGGVFIHDNPLLDGCDIDALAARLSGGGLLGDFSSGNNGGSCPNADCVVEGDLVIDTPSALDAAFRCVAVTGDLELDGDALDIIELPELREVGGALLVVGEPDYLSLPQLLAVGAELEVPKTTFGTFRSLPALAEVGGKLTIGGRGHLSLPALESLPGDLHDLGLSHRLRLDALRAVEGQLRVGSASRGVSAPQLTQVGGRLRLDARAEVSVPELASIGGELFVDRDAQLDAGMLHTVPGRLVLDAGAALNATLLSHVGGDVIIYTRSLPQLPSLTSIAGELRLSSTDVSLPSLASVGPAGVAIAHGTATPLHYAFPALGDVDRLLIHGNANFTAPALTRVGTLDADTSRLDLALPALETADAFSVRNANDSVTLTLTALSEVSGPFTVADNAALAALVLPALDYAGAVVDLSDNPALAPCVVEVLIDQLIAGGSPGPFDSSGNAPCP